MKPDEPIEIRNSRPEDIDGIIGLCREVYPHVAPWSRAQLGTHLRLFPEGQFVAVTADSTIVGAAFSLIIHWEDYNLTDSWRDFTSGGTFANHDPEHGHTLYGAEVMVSPALQGHHLGTRLYEARMALARRLGLRRIRAGARLRGYHAWSDRLSALDYARAVEAGAIYDPTLTFQVRRGFHVLGVVPSYLPHDPETLGYAAVIEWINPDVETHASDRPSAPGESPQPPA